jgi:hypothetical protein
MLERYAVKLVGRVYIKEQNTPINHISIYNNSVQYICEHFESYLQYRQSPGIVIMDSRSTTQNIQAAHSIFTQKFKAGGDAYPSLMEAPAFGHSDNHAGLQIADLISSGYLWPMTMHAYCEAKIVSIHVRPDYWRVADRYGERIKRLQHRYQLTSGLWSGGISVSDRLAKQSGSLLYRATPPAPPTSLVPPASP